MLLAASAVFAYYTFWAILLVHVLFNVPSSSYEIVQQPFFDSSSQLHSYFPPREWAVRIPAFLLVVGLSAIGAFVGTTIVKENRKTAQKARLRAA